MRLKMREAEKVVPQVASKKGRTFVKNFKR